MRAHYGQAPERNYMAGCSNGGRHALVAATRYGDRYDGILAGAPGLNLPKAAVQHAWDVQSWQLADPDIRKAFSPDRHEDRRGQGGAALRRARRRRRRHRRRPGRLPGDLQDRRTAVQRRQERAVSVGEAGRCTPARLRRSAQQQGRDAVQRLVVGRGHRLGQLALLEAREPDPALEPQPVDRDDGRRLAELHLHDPAHAHARHARRPREVPRRIRLRPRRTAHPHHRCHLHRIGNAVHGAARCRQTRSSPTCAPRAAS